MVSNLAAGNYRFSARADLSSGITLMAPQTEIRLLPVLDLFEDAIGFTAPAANWFLDYSQVGSGLQAGEPGNTNSLRSSLWLKTTVPGPGLLTVSIHNGDPVKAETFLGSSLA